jgi:hypothetical protein
MRSRIDASSAAARIHSLARAWVSVSTLCSCLAEALTAIESSFRRDQLIGEVIGVGSLTVLVM